MSEDPRFDTAAGLVKELTEINSIIAEMEAPWSQEAGELKMLEKRYDRLLKAALRGTTGKNADERAATAHAAVEASAEGISERIEELTGNVTTYKTRFESVSRRSSNAQSILKMRREEGMLDQYVARDPTQPERRGR